MEAVLEERLKKISLFSFMFRGMFIEIYMERIHDLLVSDSQWEEEHGQVEDRDQGSSKGASRLSLGQKRKVLATGDGVVKIYLL